MIDWTDSGSADYLRLGVLKEGIYRVSAADIATASGISTNDTLDALSAGEFSLLNGTNSIAWMTDGTNLFFYGQATDHFYAPENVYFLRHETGKKMSTLTAPPDPSGGTNSWFMQSGSHRSEILNVIHYYDRRSSNASITNELNFGVYLGYSSYGSRYYCEFTPVLSGYVAGVSTNLNIIVQAISYGDFGAAYDTHSFQVLVEGSSCGSFSWDLEQKVSFEAHASTSLVADSQPVVRISSLNTAEHLLLIDVDIEYPRSYELLSEPLLFTGGVSSNIAVFGNQTNLSPVVWDISDPFNVLDLDVTVNSDSNGWSSVFSCGDAAKRYAVFEKDSCFQPSVCGFSDIDWTAPGSIPALVIVTPPRRWVSGFEAALQPLVNLRRAQGLGVRVVDAEDVYNAFSSGLASPHAFRRFVNAGANHGSEKLRYLLFAGYTSTDYKLEVFHPDTIFKNGQKGFPALFPLLQVSQIEPESGNMYLLPNDVMLGDGDGDGVPEVSVGRYLACDSTELSNMVAKTVKHDSPHPWNSSVMVADWDWGNVPDRFENTVSGVSNEFYNSGWSVDYYYRKDGCSFTSTSEYYPDESISLQVRKSFFYDNKDFFYYLGHSSDRYMGGSSADPLLKAATLPDSYYKWQYPPFAMSIGCNMGRHTALDIVNLSVCLMETAAKPLYYPYSGFCGSISFAGFVSFGDAIAVSQLMSEEINLYGAKRIGDALTATYDQMGAGCIASIQHLVFIGDPSMPVYKPRYPTIFKLR